MAVMLFILMALFCAAAVESHSDYPLKVEEMRAIQERLERFEGLEKTYKSLTAPEHEREEECLPEGAGCSFGSGPNCCGVKLRCHIFDHYIPQRGGPAKWISVCRPYNVGVAADEIADFFKRLG